MRDLVSLTLRDCIVSGNTAGHETGYLELGGVIFADDLVTIQAVNTTFADNVAVSGDGGVVCLGDNDNDNSLLAVVDFVDCRFFRNSAATLGGVVYVTSGYTNVTFVSSQIVGNSASAGSVVHSKWAWAVNMTDWLVENNTAISAGAILVQSLFWSSFQGCTFRNNMAVDRGGALIVIGAGGFPTNVTDCVFEGNR